MTSSTISVILLLTAARNISISIRPTICLQQETRTVMLDHGQVLRVTLSIYIFWVKSYSELARAMKYIRLKRKSAWKNRD